MENRGGFGYKILHHVGLLGEGLGFFVSIGIAEILGFSGLSVCAGVVLLEVFTRYFGLCFCCGYWRGCGVVGFCGLGDKTFESDFNSWIVK